MSEELVVRSAALDDLEPVWMLACALATSAVLRREPFENSFATLVTSPGHLLLVAVVENDVLGYVHALMHPAFHANGPMVWVEELMVTQAERRRGAGRLLMSAVEAWARDVVGAAYVALATRRATGFYLGIGYEDSARYLKKTLLPPLS